MLIHDVCKTLEFYLGYPNSFRGMLRNIDQASHTRLGLACRDKTPFRLHKAAEVPNYLGAFIFYELQSYHLIGNFYKREEESEVKKF